MMFTYRNEENFYDDFVPEFPEEIEDLPAQHREEINAPIEEDLPQFKQKKNEK